MSSTTIDSYYTPYGVIEDSLCAITKEILKIENVSIYDDFFNLGIDSDSIKQLANSFSTALDSNIRIDEILKYHCINDLIIHYVDHDGITIPQYDSLHPKELSFAQQRLYFIDKFEEGTSSYNFPNTYKLSAVANIRYIKKTIEYLIDRHEILKTIVQETENGQTFQVLNDFPFEIDEVFVDTENALQEQILKEARYIFDLHTAPPIKVTIYHLHSDLYLCINVHQIAYDRWSRLLFLKEFQQIYLHLKNSTPLSLPDLSISYGDFARWQREYFTGDILQKQLSYWQKQLADLTRCELPTDYPRPKKIDYNTKNHSYSLDVTLSQQITALAKKNDVTEYVFMLSVFNVLLYKYSHQSDVTIGTTVINRHFHPIENLIGPFANTLVLRNTIEDFDQFSDFLEHVKYTTVSALQHQDIPFEHLIDFLGISADPGRHPIFGISFDMQQFEGSDINDGMLLSLYRDNSFQAAKYDVELYVNKNIKEETFTLLFNYNTSLFKPSTIENFADAYVQILHQVISDTNTTIANIKLKLPQHDSELIDAVNNTVCPDILEALAPLHQLFINQVQKTPDTIGVIDNRGQFTYAELNAASNAIAAFLHANGLARVSGKQQPVAIYSEKSHLQVTSIMGILKSGTFFLPIGEWPLERIQIVLQEAGVKTILTSRTRYEKIHELSNYYNVLIIEDLHEYNYDRHLIETLPTCSLDDLAYVIYTSGSTGKPKGVMASHKGVANTVLAVNNRLNIGNGDCAFAISDLSFDLSAYDIFGLLAAGGSILFPQSARREEPEYWCQLIEKYKATLWNSVPQLVELLYDTAHDLGNGLTSLKVVMMSGDYIPLSLPPKIKALTPHVFSMSLGGATEGSIWSIWYDIDQIDPTWKTVPYGIPLPNQGIYVLDKALDPCPIGTLGELYIAGISVAPGYYKDPERSAHAFISHETLGTIYKTGDLGVLHPEGYYDFRGRADFQVKINGYRIELEEIESVLAAHHAIEQAIVISKKHQNNPYLVAYFTSADPEFRCEELNGYLSERLPQYMVPQHIVMLNHMPLTVNGKLDRNALPEPTFEADNYSAPRDETEKILCEAFENILKLERVGIHDNFFHLGGNSIQAIQLVRRIESALGYKFTIGIFFQSSTVAALAELFKNKGDIIAHKQLVDIRSGTKEDAVFLLAGGGGHVIAFSDLLQYLEHDRPVYGLELRGLDGTEAPYADMEEVINDYIKLILSKQNGGEYTLIGYSFGGYAAYAIACKLQKMGKNIKHLILIGTSFHASPVVKIFNHTLTWTNVFLSKYQMQQYVCYLINKTIRVSKARTQKFIRNLKLSKKQRNHDKLLANVYNNAVIAVNNMSLSDRFQGDVLLIRETLFPSFLDPRIDYASSFQINTLWEKYLDGNLTSVDITCTHPDMLNSNYLEQYMPTVLEYLNPHGLKKQLHTDIAYWSLPLESCPLSNDECQIFFIQYNEHFAAVHDYSDFLNQTELQRASQYKFEKDAHRFIIRRYQLKKRLAMLSGKNIKNIQISETQSGKPYLDTGLTKAKINFTLSHTDDYALIAITKNHNIGIDIEMIDSDINASDLSKRFFSNYEYKALAELHQEIHNDYFTRLWTCKEAYVKARGIIPFDQFTFNLENPNKPVLLQDNVDPAQIGKWCFRHVNIDYKHVMTVCLDTNQHLHYKYYLVGK
jgi:amino acid adenylation domain-containing protein